jgi:hypothetical protein
MVLLIAAVALGLLTVPLGRGHLSALGQTKLRFVPAIFGALAIQIVIISVAPGGNPAVHRVLHVGSYALAAVFLVANRRIPGMWIVTAGAACNLVAIVANGGVMPASKSALHTAGIATTGKDFANSVALAHPRLLFLGDLFGVPKSWPLANAYSIGDLLIAIGIVIVIHALSHTPSSLSRTGAGTKNHSWASTSYKRVAISGRRRTTRGSSDFDANENVQNAPG